MMHSEAIVVKRTRAYRLIGIISSMILLGACSMINPHINVGNRPSTVQKLQGNGPLQPRDVPLHEAIAYADAVKDSYRGALGDEAKFKALLGVGLIGIATAVPAMALTQASTKSIGVLAMSGAGAYGLGTWLPSTPRQKAYIQGYNAVDCAVEAVIPLSFDPVKDPYRAFSNALAIDSTNNKATQFNSQISDVEKAMASVRDMAETPDEQHRAQLAIDGAEKAVDEARKAHRAAVSLQVEINKAGLNLVSAIDRIIGEVDLAILQNQVNLEALSSIIGGLGSTYSQLRTGPPGLAGASDVPAKTTVTPTGVGTPFDLALQDLRDEVAKLAATTRSVSDYIASVMSKKPLEKLAKCGVDPNTIATDMHIDPPTAMLSSSEGGAATFRITGGVRPYRATLLGNLTTHVTVAQQPDPFGPAFVVQVAQGTPNGTYSVYIIDGAGRSAIAEIKVGPTASPTASTSPQDAVPATGSPTASTSPQDDVKTAEIKRIQKALCVNPDGIFGEKSARALRDYQIATHKTVDGRLTEPLQKELMALPDTEIDKRCKKPQPTARVAEQIKSLASSLIDVAFHPSADPSTIITVEKATVEREVVMVTLKITPPQGGRVRGLMQVGVKQDLLSMGKKAGANVNDLSVNNITIANLDSLVQAGLLEK
jgi:hypothetical protein